MMGVRFPVQQPRPDFGPIQQADNARQAVPQQQQEVQEPGQAVTGRAQEPAEENNAIRETQQPQALIRQPTAERAADDAGAQTPGSIIDMLA
jgi:hypothetical protein